MSSKNSFPRTLLLQPKEVQLAYFEGYKAAHPRLVDMNKTLMRNINQSAGASFIFVYGPTGIGKTTMRLRVEQELIEQALPTLITDRGCIPVVGVEAVGTESGNFNWKDYFTRALAALEEPLIDHKINYGTRGIQRNSSGQLVIEPKVAAPELRRALENALKHRRPKAFFIDEAQHMQKMASGRRLQDNMDCLKSLANLTGVVHVLIGTYELLMFRNLSAQLSRRSVDLHFSRYRADVSEELEAFMNVLWTFQRHLPLENEPDLLTHWKYFYAYSLGCVGILKDWLHRALSDALNEGALTLTLKHLQQRAWSDDQCHKMLQEITEGEKQLTQSVHKRQKLYEALGLGGEQEPTPSVNSGSEALPKPQNEAQQSRRRNLGVGKPNPQRRKVGGVE